MTKEEEQKIAQKWLKKHRKELDEDPDPRPEVQVGRLSDPSFEPELEDEEDLRTLMDGPPGGTAREIATRIAQQIRADEHRNP